MKKYKFFTNSQKAWKSMFEAISGAKKSVYLEMYIFDDNLEDFDFFNLLKKKSEQGLQVKIILDSLGSARFSSSAVSELDRAGAEVLSLSYLLHRMHRKVLVVDERIAFLGGVNIHKNSRFWNDLMVRITGKLAEKAVASFAKSYFKAGGKDQNIQGIGRRIKRMKADSGIVEHYPLGKKFHFNKIYKDYLGKAKQSIILITPYIIPRRWLAAALHQAVLRGVKVEVLVPKTVDHFITDRANFFYIYKLAKLGIKFYIEPAMNHAKAILIDEKEAMVGSQNLDFLSFDLNSEVGVFFKDPQSVAQLSAITREWKKKSVLFDPKIHKPRWYDYLISPPFKLLSRIF